MTEVRLNPKHGSLEHRIHKRTRSSSPDHGKRPSDHNRSDHSATTTHETKTSIYANGGGSMANKEFPTQQGKPGSEMDR
jgi:hypothetical protein